MSKIEMLGKSSHNKRKKNIGKNLKLYIFSANRRFSGEKIYRRCENGESTRTTAF